eukprot:SAG31_NODE_29573_length_393_cov_0.693878_1_plen_81_part_01
MRSTIKAPNGSVVWTAVSRSLSIAPDANRTVIQSATLPMMLLWDAELAPALHTLLTELVAGADVLADSSRETRFGIRRMDF